MTRSYLFILTLFVIPFYSYSQSKYFLIDHNSKSVPDTITEYADIAAYLTKDLITDRDKSRALYVWIAHNIQYDLELYDRILNGEFNNQSIQETVSLKKGVCKDYSDLFCAMGTLVGIDCEVISGYTKNYSGEISGDSHAWNAVRIGQQYYLLDITWAAGHVTLSSNKYVHRFSDNYFLIPPGEFIKDHMPFDPIWQFSSTPINNEKFISGDFSEFKKEGTFIFSDSIKYLKNIAEATLYQDENRRIKQSGLENPIVKKMAEKILNHNSIMMYNLGITSFNNGLGEFRTYIDYRNKRFRRPKVDDETIRKLIDGIEDKVNYANDIFHKVYRMEYRPKELIESNEKSINETNLYIAREKEFVDRYLNTWKPLRFFIM